jgi:hypothetical protein
VRSGASRGQNWPIASTPHRPGLPTDWSVTRNASDDLVCDEERVRRWESGEVRWPSPPYRRALKELTGLGPDQLGFISRERAAVEGPVRNRINAADAFRSEAELFDTLDLARMVTVSDLGQGTLDTLQEAADLLCRAYPTASAGELKARSKQRLSTSPGC